jgi:hypothetical protein
MYEPSVKTIIYYYLFASNSIGKKLNLIYNDYNSELLQNYYETINNINGQIIGNYLSLYF